MCECVCVRVEAELEEIIQYITADGFKHQVSRNEVKKAIMWLHGVDNRTIEKWLKALETFEYLIPLNPSVYKLNPLKVPSLFSTLKEKPQTKLL